MKRLILISVLAAVCGGALASVVFANLAQDGSFEQGFEQTTTINGGWPNNAGLYAAIGHNNSPDTIPGWTVSGAADWHDSSVTTSEPHAQDGFRFVDLNGGNDTPGATLSQSIATTANGAYILSFYYAAHPYCSSFNTRSMLVSAGSASGVFTANAVLEGYANTPFPVWKAGTLSFTASGAATTLSFQSLTNFDCGGPLVDNVSVEQVLPTTTDQCKEGGWQAYGVFKNQGDCVSFVATQGKNPPAN